jgi:hypothetical protein
MLNEAGNLGSRSDEAHLSFQYVPKLGQLIQFCLSQDPADSSDAWIAVPCHGGLSVVGLGHHSAKFADQECPTALSNSSLTVKNVAAVRDFHECCYHQ